MIIKCDYCRRKATYSLAAHLINRIVELHACDKHVAQGYSRQQSVLMMERLRESCTFRSNATFRINANLA